MSSYDKINYYKKLAEDGDANAQFSLALMYIKGKDVPQDNAEAVKWFHRAAEQGNAKAQTTLGIIYLSGKYVNRNDQEALKWLRTAVEQESADAQCWLGWMYKNGRGVSRDNAAAVKWYQKAAEQGLAKAQYQLGKMYYQGQGVSRDNHEAIEWYRKAAEQGHADAQYCLARMYSAGEGVPEGNEEAIVWYRKAAVQGHEDAQYQLGEIYYYGQGVPEDNEEAFEWYRKAAEQGHANAQFRLGHMYSESEGVSEDKEVATEWYRKAAEQEHADAQYQLGEMYYYGQGVPEDNEEAIEWYQKAAEQGSADAQYQLGEIYYYGQGVPEDNEEAFEWYQKAAAQGHANAQFRLGHMYSEGEGVSEDDDEAREWYQRAAEQGQEDAIEWYRNAAEQGSADAQYQLGEIYYYGQGVPEDNEEAIKWYRRAAKQGHQEAIDCYRNAAEQGPADAQYQLGEIYYYGQGVPEDNEEAIKWYQKAAAQGHKNAQGQLGFMYSQGKGVPQDPVEAVKWFRKAAKQGNANAQSNLGVMYENGTGVRQSDTEAVKWYLKAAEQGDAAGQVNLGTMYENGKGVPQDNTEAVKWFHKASEQGNERAKEHLARLKAKGISIEVERKPPSDQIEDSTVPDSEDRKRRTSVHSSSDIKECKALLDACTPQLYLRNAFRISGIPVDASMRDIKRRIDDIKAAAEMGDLKDELIHAFALEPTPSFDQIREAAQRLQEPEQRIIDEFFWFWPYESGKSDDDSALRALKYRDYDSAFRIWSDAIPDNHVPKSTVAKHNLAIMYHLKALDSEQTALKSNLATEQLFTMSMDWRTCFKLWEELVEDETLWSLFANRIRILDDPRLTTGFARRLRATLPEAIDKINAMLAIDFAESGKMSQATTHINYMKETHQGKDNVARTLSFITKPHKARVTSAIEKATSITQKQPDQGAKEANELLQAISEPLKVIQTILPPEDHERIDLCDTVAEACLTCQIAYARESEDWTTSLEILDAALKYATSKETKDRLKDNRSNVAVNKHLGSLMEKIKEIEELNISIADKMADIRNDLLPHLSSIKKFPGMSDDVFEKCADAVARYIRGLSISEYNETSNLIGALRIIEISISIACGKELCEQLQGDKAHLINIQKETTKHNLQMQIRSDEIEVTNEFVRYNNQQILVSNIQGIKYGVFIQTINGVRTSSYLIDIADTQSRRIKIECKRLFRNETQAEADFNRIMEALYHQVVPALVQKLTEGILSGCPLQAGNCRLTKEGMYITTGSLLWKKETLVRFSDSRFSSYAGQINISSAKDKAISASMAIRDIWNATLLEFITKALVEMAVKR